jgi:septal ring factor EnvC (AmiA/AmiB activator)
MEISTKEIQILEKQVSPLVKQAGDYKVDSIEAVDEASVFLKKVRDTEKNLEAKRQEFTAPLNQSLKAINETFKQLKNPLEQARNLLTNKILTWKRAETERLAKEEARRRAIQEAHEKKGHEVKAPVVLERPENKIGNTQTRKVWTFEVVDFSKVPGEYKSINQVAVNQAVRSGVREIKGLRIYQEEKLSIVGR